jgi:nucleoside-triphosphatase
MFEAMILSSAYLVSGEPRVGKSTLVKRLVEAVGHERCSGFYTKEIRDGGRRTGFRLVTLDGRSSLLAHEHIHSFVRYGRYDIDRACLDRLGVAAIREAVAQGQLTILDEIGPIEAHSVLFRQIVLNIIVYL